MTDDSKQLSLNVEQSQTDNEPVVRLGQLIQKSIVT